MLPFGARLPRYRPCWRAPLPLGVSQGLCLGLGGALLVSFSDRVAFLVIRRVCDCKARQEDVHGEVQRKPTVRFTSILEAAGAVTAINAIQSGERGHRSHESFKQKQPGAVRVPPWRSVVSAGAARDLEMGWSSERSPDTPGCWLCSKCLCFTLGPAAGDGKQLLRDITGVQAVQLSCGPVKGVVFLLLCLSFPFGAHRDFSIPWRGCRD